MARMTFIDSDSDEGTYEMCSHRNGSETWKSLATKELWQEGAV